MDDIIASIQTRMDKEAKDNSLRTSSYMYDVRLSVCIKCLGPVLLEDFLKNDHYCNYCNEAEETYPHSSPSHFEVYRPIDHYGLN